MQLKAKFMRSKYELIPLENFTRNLGFFHKGSQKKIWAKIEEMLSVAPYRYTMLIGKITVRGMKFYGLRHMKVGVKGIRGGAYILYRICEECKEYEYWKKSDVQCNFCDDKKGKHIVLFAVRPRSFGYK